MNDFQPIVGSIQAKVGKLVEAHKKIRKELNNLKSENEKLTQSIEDQKLTIKDLEEKAKVLKLSKSISNNNEKNTDLKLKINELIREVDKCISLLNK